MAARHWIAGVVLIVLIGACGSAGPPPVRQTAAPTTTNAQAPPRTSKMARIPRTFSDETRSLMWCLDEADFWSLGGLGIRGEIGPGEMFTRDLAERPDAIEAFAWLAEHGAPVARLYAYWALRTLAPDRARSFAAALEADRTPIVSVAGGCIGGSGASRVAAIARAMRRPGTGIRPMRRWPAPQLP